jgi:hypothetical protein
MSAHARCRQKKGEQTLFGLIIMTCLYEFCMCLCVDLTCLYELFVCLCVEVFVCVLRFMCTLGADFGHVCVCVSVYVYMIHLFM